MSKIAVGNYEKNSRWTIMDNITVGLFWVLVINNYMLLLSWIAYIILIIIPFLISHFFTTLYLDIHNPIICLSHIFFYNKGLLLNHCEWKCVHHEGCRYSLILRGCLAKRTSRTKFYSGWHKSTFMDNAFTAWFYSIVRSF